MPVSNFPIDDLLGIDYVYPDYSYIVSKYHKVKSLCQITQCHENHIGGIPFIKTRNLPIIAGPLASALFGK